MQDFQMARKELQGGAVLLDVSGGIDAATSSRLRETFKELFEQKRYRIIMDLSKLEFISAKGVDVLVEATDTAHENAGNVIIVNLSVKVKTILDFLCVTPLFTFNTLEAAEKRFEGETQETE
jgi:anti-sigma B factor antagonist